MQSDHRTHLLFLHPVNEPTEEPIEDRYTQKVDYIFSTLRPSVFNSRGFHTTNFGKKSDSKDYRHPVYNIISNSLAPYYIRHHRQDISQKQLDWIDELYNIVQMPEKAYYKPLLDLKGETVYIKVWLLGPTYGKAVTSIIKTTDSEEVVDKIEGGFYQIISEDVYNSIFDQNRQVFTVSAKTSLQNCIKRGNLIEY